MEQPASVDPWNNAGALFKALSSPLRIGIVMTLTQGERTVSDLVDVLGVSQPLVSQHLKVLRDHCLVQTERRGREISYSLMDDHVAHIVADAVEHVIEHDPNADRADHASRKETT